MQPKKDSWIFPKTAKAKKKNNYFSEKILFLQSGPLPIRRIFINRIGIISGLEFHIYPNQHGGKK